MHTHTESFESSLSPDQVLDRFRQMSAEKGWKIKEDGPTSVKAQEGVNLKNAGETIEVTAVPGPEGAKVDLVVTPRLGALQVVDWGQGAEIAQEVTARLVR